MLHLNKDDQTAIEFCKSFRFYAMEASEHGQHMYTCPAECCLCSTPGPQNLPPTHLRGPQPHEAFHADRHVRPVDTG